MRSESIPGVAGRAHDPLGALRDRLGSAWDRIRRPAATGVVTRRRVAGALLAATLAVAFVPAIRWPVLRVGAGAMTTVTDPIRPGVASFGSLDRTTTFVDTHGETLLRVGGGRRADAVAYADLPPHVPHAVLAAEDRNFFAHPGIDPTAITRAAIAQINGGSQGGSTITQQLAKLNFTGDDNTIVRKLHEVTYAAELERKYTKEDLLERYLNQVYFGDGAYGIAAAAATFFDVAARDLTIAQAATLAGKIKAPDGLDPHENPDAVLDRRNDVISAMAGEGWIEGEQAEAARREPLGVAPQGPPMTSRAPWFLEYVKAEARGIAALGPDPDTRLGRLLNAGYRVETTLDLGVNDHAAAALAEELDKPESPTGAVVSVAPGDGAVRVMVGGVDFARQQFNATVQAHRQPGSTFKPFVYLAAIDEGVDPRSTVSGHSPQTFEHTGEKFEVNNYAKKSYGTLTLDAALVRSVNTIYMALGLHVGPGDVVKAAKRAGIDADVAPVPAAALGGTNPGVTPLEMAEAYATLAASGVHAEPYSIERILDVDGKVVYERTPKTREAIAPEHVYLLNRPLLETVKAGTGQRAAIPDRQVAGKTGTSSDFRDAWFVGYVPQLATAVWVGHLDNRSMTETIGSVSGGSIPAGVFKSVMVTALEGVAPQAIPTMDPDDADLRKVRFKTKKKPPGPSTTSTTAPPESTTTAPPEATPATTAADDPPSPTTTATEPRPAPKPKSSPTTTTAPPPPPPPPPPTTTTSPSPTTTTEP